MSNKDKTKLVINPITGKLDVIKEFNTNKIVTHDRNKMGNKMYLYDPDFDQYVPADDLIVTDNEGNVVSL